MEFICKYGPLGYGYSHQLHGLSEKTPAQEVEDSVFFRLPGIDVSQIHSSLSIFSFFDNFSLNVILGTKRYRWLSFTLSYWSSFLDESPFKSDKRNWKSNSSCSVMELIRRCEFHNFLSLELWLKLIFSLPVSYRRIPKTVIIWGNWLKSDLDTRKWQLNLQKSLIDMNGCNIWSRRFYTLEGPLIKTMLVSHTVWLIQMVQIDWGLNDLIFRGTCSGTW